MAGAQRRKSKYCHKLCRPDPCNRYHQRYCAAPSCRVASKAAGQARWLAAPREPGLFPRTGECRPGQGVAIA
jgi:hypothetical protein